MTLTDAVESLRRHDAQLVEFLDGLLGELGNIKEAVNAIKRSLLTQCGDTKIVDALDELGDLEQQWAAASGDEIKARRAAVDIIMRLQRVYPTALGYLDQEERDPVVSAVAQDICDRSLELADELPAAVGLEADTIDMSAVLRGHA